MRGTIPDLPTPHPLLGELPVVYLEHDFLGRFLAALDEVLAPVLLTLDNLGAHLDPGTAPEDFLRWLAGWLAVDIGAEPSLERSRSALETAVARHRWRGTRRGLADLVRQQTGIEPEIVETGGATWSSSPGDPPASPSRAAVTVRIRPPAPAPVDPVRLDPVRLEHLVAAEVPAHVSYSVEILPVGEQP